MNFALVHCTAKSYRFVTIEECVFTRPARRVLFEGVTIRMRKISRLSQGVQSSAVN
jgi:hypothetical protein